MAKPKHVNYSRTTLATLTSLAQARGLPTHGTKIDLISRLVEQDHAIALDNKRMEVEVRAAAAAGTSGSNTSNTNSNNSGAAPGPRAKRRRKRTNKNAARGDKENGSVVIGGTVDTDFGPITVEGTTVVPDKKKPWLGKVTSGSDVDGGVEMKMEPELLEHVVDGVVSVAVLLLSVGAAVCGLLVLVAVVHLARVWVGGV